MGFFDFLKRKNKIFVDFDISSEPVFVYPTNKIKLPMQAIVPPNCEMFLCDGGKILDSFGEGEHQLCLASLPKCDKRFGLSKPNKEGRLPKYFFCDVYIVNKILFKYKPFSCFRKAQIFDKKVGQFKVGICGGYAFEILDSKKFLANLLCEYNRLKNKEAEKIVSGYVGQFVLDQIEKSQYGIEDFLYPDQMIDDLFEKINKKLDFLNIKFLGFDIKQCKLPKHLRLVKQNILQETQIGENVFLGQTKIEKNDLETKKTNKDFQTQNTNLQNSFENNIKKTSSNSDFDQTELLHFGKKDCCKKDKDSIFLQQDNTSLDKKTVDNNCNLDYDKTIIRCLFCGYENDGQSEKCALCGQSLKRKGRL